ncbi:DUF106 domain-containing protein [archaeon]|nr:DUF106 domain-containing protein [archaeon]
MFEQLINVFDIIFSPLIVLKPHISLLIISTFVTVLVLFTNKIFINKNVVREIKQKMENIREQITRAQKEGNMEEANKFLTEMMKTNGELMRHTLKGMIVSLIVLSLFLPWIKHTYEVTYKGVIVAKLPFSLPYVGSSLDWLLWYVLVSITIGWIIRKLLGVDYA